MPKVKVADGEIAYEEAGSGHPLVFVSGLGGTGGYWAPQLKVFGARYRSVIYDQRGTGGSDRTQRTFSVDQMTAELVGLMDALKIDKAHIIGLSTGGAIGQTLAIEYPQRIASLIAVSTWTHCDPWFRRLFEARRTMYREAGSALHQQFHPLWLYPPDYVNTHDAEIDEERRKSVANAPPVEVSIGRIDAIMAFDRRKDLGRIKAPTMIVASDNDYITPSYYAEALGRAIPNAKLVIMKGGGHSLTKTQPDEFNRLALDFLDSK